MLKKLKLFRKAFLTDFIKFHYSQFGEDIILREILKKEISNGFYIDVGCYHPKKFSNTYMLYKKGWSGINIDMEEDKISLFNMVRPRDLNVLSPISDKEEEVTLYRYSKYGLGSTIDKKIASETTDHIYDKTIVKTRTLNEIINESPYKDTQIDVLSIDAEGVDFKILKSLDIKKYSPKVIIIEDHHKKIEDILETDTFKFLVQNNYILRSWSFYSLIFILPGSNILKERENN
jgi:FkbM family methyltransferase